MGVRGPALDSEFNARLVRRGLSRCRANRPCAGLSPADDTDLPQLREVPAKADRQRQGVSSALAMVANEDADALPPAFMRHRTLPGVVLIPVADARVTGAAFTPVIRSLHESDGSACPTDSVAFTKKSICTHRWLGIRH